MRVRASAESGTRSSACSSSSAARSNSRWFKARFAARQVHRGRPDRDGGRMPPAGAEPASARVPAPARRAARAPRRTTRRSSFGVRGLERKSMAPSFIAATASGMLPCAVTMTTGTSLPASRNRRNTSMPPRPGIRRSRRTSSRGGSLEMVEGVRSVLGLVDRVAGRLQGRAEARAGHGARRPRSGWAVLFISAPDSCPGSR